MSEQRETARRDARTAGETARDGGARCVAIVGAANVGLALAGAAAVARFGIGGVGLPMFGLALAAAVQAFMLAQILKGGAA